MPRLPRHTCHLQGCWLLSTEPRRASKIKSASNSAPHLLHNPVIAKQIQERNSQNTNQEPQVPQHECSAPSAHGHQLSCTSHHCPGTAWGIPLLPCHCWVKLESKWTKKGFFGCLGALLQHHELQHHHKLQRLSGPAAPGLTLTTKLIQTDKVARS